MRELSEILTLKVGAHKTFQDGVCAMELVAWMAGEPHSDHPECASPVIAAYVRRLNDRMPDAERQQLAPYLVRIIGTVGTTKQERQRGFTCADAACRVFAPLALHAVGLDTAALQLEQMKPVTDKRTAAAAYAAAVNAANAAAYAAAVNAANAAAYAARAAANAAAVAAAAYVAARAADAWPEALALLDRLIAVTETPQQRERHVVVERVIEARRQGVMV